ncbi:MAG: hypothetical protein RDV41_05880 [Planctomycetota bacterium]|nr:hypothetical protein [Planctomycetota bacterium]
MRTCTRIVVLLPVLIAIAVALRPDLCRAQQGPQAKLQEFQRLLKERKEAGADTSEAERLQRESREAARNGDLEKAERLLDQAIQALNGSTPDRRPEEKPGKGPDKKPGSGPDEKPDKKPGKGPLPDGKPPAEGSQPVYFWPFTHHYAGPGGYYPTAQEVRSIADFWAAHKIPGTLFVDGILVERLQKEDPAIFEHINKLGLYLGYHGDETHGPYPVPTDLLAMLEGLKGKNMPPEQSMSYAVDWKDAVDATISRYSHRVSYSVDEKTRMLDRSVLGKEGPELGGLALVQKVFGRDVSAITAHGLESAPTGWAWRKMSKFAFDQPAVPVATHALKIFGVKDLEQRVSEVADSATVFWHMGRIASLGTEGLEMSPGSAGAARAGIARLDRSRPNIVCYGFSLGRRDLSDCLEPIRYLEEEFFPANPGSRWASPDDLMKLAEPEHAYGPGPDEVLAIARALEGGWKGRPPGLVNAAGRTYSLCESFEALARSLAEFHEKGAWPQKVELTDLLGPISTGTKGLLASPRKIQAKEICAIAGGILKTALAADPPSIPGSVTVAGVPLGAGELLIALAHARIAIAEGRADFEVARSDPVPPYGDVLDEIFPTQDARPNCYTKLQLWTVKPVVFGQATPPSEEKPPEEKPRETGKGATGKFRVVFATNLNSGGGCFREDPSGADLFCVDVDLAAKAVARLKPLVGDPDAVEWFPAISPDGALVAYNRGEKAGRANENSVHVVNIETGKDQLLIERARFPQWMSDGKKIICSLEVKGRKDIYTMDVAPTGAGGELVATGQVRLTGPEEGKLFCEDPSPFPDGSGFSFHVKNGQDLSAQVGIGDLTRKSFVMLTDADGSGHSAVSPDGSVVVFSSSQSGELWACRKEGDRWSAKYRLPVSARPEDYAGYDTRYKTARIIGLSYMEWLDNSRLLVSVQAGEKPREFGFSRLFIVTLMDKGSELFDFSSAVEKLADTTGMDFCTGCGTALKEAE